MTSAVEANLESLRDIGLKAKCESFRRLRSPGNTVVLPYTLCGGISATHFPASKKYLRFYDRKLKIYTVIATYI